MKKFPKISPALLPFIKRPYLLLFNLTQRCNLRCTYCFGRYYNDKNELTFSQIKKILEDFYKLGVRRLGLSGGEPLLHPEIDRVIKTAVRLGYEVGINSNGILVPQHLEPLKLVDNLSISFDSPYEAEHEKNRGKKTFTAVLKGIQAAHNADIPLHLCCTLTKTNLNRWREILKFAKKFNARVQFSPLYPNFVNRKKYNWQKYGLKIKKTISEILKEKKNKGNNIFFSNESYKALLTWDNWQEDILLRKKKSYPNCLAGRKIIFLDSSGRLYPCLRASQFLPGINCLKIGARRAYKKLAEPACLSCRWICFLEYNFLLNFNLSVIVNFWENR